MTAPDFATVRGWRGEQEARLRERLSDPARTMDAAALDRFVMHYERLTRWIAEDLPAVADVTVRLDGERLPIEQPSQTDLPS